MKKRLFDLGLPVLAFVVTMALWESIVRFYKVPLYLLPAPSDVLSAVFQRFSDLLSSFLITAEEALGGFILSTVLGLIGGLFLALSPLIRRTFFPYIVVLQTIPIIAISPLIILWLGSGVVAVLFIAFVICVPSVIANTTQGLISVERNHLDLFRMGNAPITSVLYKLRLPHALPSIFTGLRIAAGASVVGAIVGESFAGSTTVGRGGLGYSATYALTQLETPYLFAIVCASSLLGLGFFAVVSFMEWLFLHRWHESIINEMQE